ncbi:hypothetical protein Dsin_024921 [Dipteronia sinensis]|uniref:Pentatricopeptide repeat-containing protein n=1 Tax=Dipteronia sinensis TaxID=43782 RepID=A0AAD9ZVE4_9ROSI|nr:hypothetical protein Dsin_024921 [Dipteronia sinensis]
MVFKTSIRSFSSSSSSKTSNKPTTCTCIKEIQSKLTSSNSKPIPKYSQLPVKIDNFLKEKCKPGTVSLNEVLYFFDYMISMDFSSFNILLAALAKNKHYDKSLIHWLCGAGNWEDVKGFFIQMLDQGVQPAVVTFSVVIEDLCKNEKMDEADGLLELVIRRGVDPNTCTYNSLINGYCLMGSIDDASRLFSLQSIRKGVDLMFLAIIF